MRTVAIEASLTDERLCSIKCCRPINGNIKRLKLLTESEERHRKPDDDDDDKK
jgi:hypothetical protein